MFASLMASTATIILGGIPAAIYERFVGAKDEFDRSVAMDLARRQRDADAPGDRQFLHHRPLIAVPRSYRALVRGNRF